MTFANMATCKRSHAEETGPLDVLPSKKFASNGDRNEVDKFVEWCKNEKIAISHKVTIQKESVCAQYGMIAEYDIDEGEVLFEIPRNVILTSDTTNIADLLKTESESLKSNSGWVPLLVSLLYEYTSPHSRWRPYIDLVPDFKELDPPMFWERKERAKELKGTGIHDAVEKDLENIKKEFNKIVLPFMKKHPETFPSECHSLDMYKKMVSFVMAYSFTEPENEDALNDISNDNVSTLPVKPLPMMVPLADVLNHIAKNNANLIWGKESLKMVSLKPILKGEEVFNTYGPLANWQLLHMYGFAEQYPQNHNDTVDIPMKLVYEIAKQDSEDMDLLDEKWEFLQGLELIPDDGGFVFGTDGVLTEEELYHTLKVLSMTRSEFEEHREQEGWSDAESTASCDDKLLYKSVPSMPTLWKSIFHRVAKKCQTLYPRSLSDEEKLLKNIDVLNSRQKYAAYVRYGQLKILQHVIDITK
ncbi:N-lysine methyltransferase setd6-like [Tubulanus polymorphus]|uniref:N-lysine methyltransferase setd6-like n=1 Tax=Tubulanus polymorphus TaxID=672921 RepID=UPI003DA4C545